MNGNRDRNKADLGSVPLVLYYDYLSNSFTTENRQEKDANQRDLKLLSLNYM